MSLALESSDLEIRDLRQRRWPRGNSRATTVRETLHCSLTKREYSEERRHSQADYSEVEANFSLVKLFLQHWLPGRSLTPGYLVIDYL